MRYLLDKNVIRYLLTGLRHRHLRPLSALELGALSFWQTASTQENTILISPASLAILQRMQYREVQFLLSHVQVLFPTRYHARWSRRVRETTSLSREDAAMIALASFGTNETGTLFGVHQLITYDQPMINGYRVNFETLRRRLQAMTAQISPPFQDAVLPQINTPDAIIHQS